MTITRQAYEKHEFIRTSIDLLCAGASWHGGRFIFREDTHSKKIPSINIQFLEQFAKSLLLDGQAFIEIINENETVSITQIAVPESLKGGAVIDITREESSFFPGAAPILERFDSQIKLYEEILRLLENNPNLIDLLGNVLLGIQSALAIPSYMLDQTRYSKIPVEQLMIGATIYHSEVKQLRHIINYGLDQVGESIATILGLDDTRWEWEIDWTFDGPCKYGNVYQVFKSKGFILTPILNSEIGGMKIALENGLISNHLFTECKKIYDIN